MSEPSYLVLSALGPDRSGLVASVTQFLRDRGANIEESRMAVLGAEFGVMLLVAAEESEVSRIERELSTLSEETGLDFRARRTQSPAAHRQEAGIPCVIIADCMDQEGIVGGVSRALYDAGLNITALEASTYPAPVSGAPLFRLEARVDVPRGGSVIRVRERMRELAEAENIDIEVRTAGR